MTGFKQKKKRKNFFQNNIKNKSNSFFCVIFMTLSMTKLRFKKYKFHFKIVKIEFRSAAFDSIGLETN